MGTRAANILLVMADQMSALSLRLYGNAVTKTPQLDRLAGDGVVFDNAYCNYPLCAPARFALMSGRLPSRIGAYDNAAELPAAVPTIAHYLRARGYYTCLSGKMHFVGPDQLHGFEDRLTTEIYPADFGWTPRTSYDEGADDRPKAQPDPGVSGVETIADAGPFARSMQLDYDEEVAHRAVQKLYDLGRRRSAPFFLVVSFTQPHDPYVITREFWDLYDDRDIDPPRVPALPLDALDPHSRALHDHYGLHRFPIGDQVLRRARRGYYGMISYIDAKLGQLLSAVEAAGFGSDTLVVITSDHGDMMGERGMWFKKTLFEQAIRVPLVLRWPERSWRGRMAQPVSLVDLLPTLNEAAGGGADDYVTEIDGRCLLGVDEDEPRPVFVEHIDGATRAPRVMVRLGDIKYVHSEAYPPQLYDLGIDPKELENLAGTADLAAAEARMRALVAETWDLERLQADVVRSQRTRRFLADTLAKGRVEAWDHPGGPDPAPRFVRRGDLFPGVERRSYLRYPDDGD